MGSGEFSPGMTKVYRKILQRINAPVAAAFLDTPAGFELNHAAISEKACAYFLENFDVNLDIASYPNALGSQPDDTASAMRILRRSDFILAGPGSPTYAVRNWRDTPVFETVAAKLIAGAHLVFSSAAALALGRWTIPVYEIYKVGEEPHWVDGLDLLGRLALPLAVVPHWNNTSGGSHDTARSFIGVPRFEALCAALPEGALVLGIDEYTSCTIDFAAGDVTVNGAGSVTVMRGATVEVFASGARFSIEQLRGSDTAAPPAHGVMRARFGEALENERNAADALSYLHVMMDHLARVPHPPDAQAQSLLMIREMTATLAVWLETMPGKAAAAPQASPNDALIAALKEQRLRLRAEKRWADADALRDLLLAHGVTVSDGKL
jgi:hypothetical protein